MRYLITAKLKPGKEEALLSAVEKGILGHGSVAGDEYLRNMKSARITDDGTVSWVEVCFCGTPLDEERPYWEPYFELLSIKDAHARSNCKDLNGTESWACTQCDCTEKLEATLQTRGKHFLTYLRSQPLG